MGWCNFICHNIPVGDGKIHHLRRLLQADEAGAVRVPVDAEGLAIPGRTDPCPGGNLNENMISQLAMFDRRVCLEIN
jgi:hypothetical protein